MKKGLIRARNTPEYKEGAKTVFSEEDKLKAAYALNLCMVSISQIVDFNDQNIVEQEYDGILNNLNLEMMPKDEALLSILKRILDTITFFKMQEGDKRLLDKEYQQKMKNAIWNAVPNFGLIMAGGNPVSMVVSLASQIGIGYMNYRRTKCENELEREKQQWQLQRSAMEQYNGLRRELFDTAWRLANTYAFPDEYRLTEKQIKQYDEVLMDTDEIRKYERLTSISGKFKAYPPFWYQYGSAANHIARNNALPLSKEARDQFKAEAINHFKAFWQQNGLGLLREDPIASSCALELIDLLDMQKDILEIRELLRKARAFSGDANDILQLCALAYLRIGDQDEAAELLRILVNEQYNADINAQILSGIYVTKVLDSNDQFARSRYETLATRISPSNLVRLPKRGESVGKEELMEEFSERQEELLREEFSAVITKIFDDFSVRLGKLIPGLNADEAYPDYYYSEEGTEQRIKEFEELFTSSYKQKKKTEYLSRLEHSGFLMAYFEELNILFDDVSRLNCIRDRQRLKELISEKIVACAHELNSLANKIEKQEVRFEDICKLVEFTSISMFSEFISELRKQIECSILGMNDMFMYVAADSKLRDYCREHNYPEPEVLIREGHNAKPDTGVVALHFGFDLLGDEGDNLLKNQKRYRKVEEIIKKNIDMLGTVSEKANAYFHDSEEFNSYFENSKLKNHKDMLQKTIAVYDDKSLKNVDILFMVDGVVPIIRNSIKTIIPYINLAKDDQKKRFVEMINRIGLSHIPKTGSLITGGVVLAVLVQGGIGVVDTKAVDHVIEHVRPMIDEICSVIIEDL